MKQVVVIILIVGFSLAIIVSIAGATTRYVCHDYDSSRTGWGTTHFYYINDAINASSGGDTIRIYHGYYQESVAVSHQLNLLGNSSDMNTGTRIRPHSLNNNALFIDEVNQGVNITSIYFKGLHGIEGEKSFNVEINNCNIRYPTYCGIKLYGCEFDIFNVDIFSPGTHGIKIYGTSVYTSYSRIKYADIDYTGRYGILLQDTYAYIDEEQVLIKKSSVRYSGTDSGSSADDGIHVDNSRDSILVSVTTNHNEGRGLYCDDSNGLEMSYSNLRFNDDGDTWDNVDDDNVWYANYYEDGSYPTTYNVGGPGNETDPDLVEDPYTIDDDPP